MAAAHPAEAVAYIDRLRELGFRGWLMEIERDSWILIEAQMPNEVPARMAIKRGQIEHEPLRRLHLHVGELADFAPDAARLPELAARMAAFIEAAAGEAKAAGVEDESPISDDLAALLDTAFVESFQCARRLLELLEDRGWTGWTDIRRKNAAM